MNAIRRCLRIVFARPYLCCLLLVAAQLAGTAGAQSANDGFDPRAYPGVARTVVQPDGKVLVAGAFTLMSDQPRTFVARVNRDGSLDSGFVPPTITGSYVSELALQPDGAALIAGNFSAVGGVPHANIARLNSNGSLDAAYAPADPGAANILLLQGDGKAIVGGASGLRRLQANGAIDPAFNVDVTGVVCADLQADGKVVIGGTFTSVSGQNRRNLARLNVDGSVDAGFAASLGSGWPRVIKVLENREILIGGYFDVLPPFGRLTTIARITSTGVLDTAFDATQNGTYVPTGEVDDLAVQADGHVLIGGTFDTVAGQSRRNVARLGPNGTLDGDFGPSIDNTVQTLSLQPDGSVLLGGDFGTVNGQVRQYVARVSPTGALDDTLLYGADGQVLALAQQPNGRILVGGSFTSMGFVPRNRLARLLGDGHVDLGFHANVSGPVQAIALQADGNILISGPFAKVGGDTHMGIARVYDGGDVDTSFNASVQYGIITGIVVQPDDALIVYGQFPSINGVTRYGIARLHADGSLDTQYDPSPNDFIVGVALQPDGSLIVGGDFTAIGGQPRDRLARVDHNGAVDPTYNPGADADPLVLALQPDGKLIVGGLFTVIAGAPHPNLARLNADGSLDTGFVADVDGPVSTLALQADGRILIGGDFNTVGGQARRGVALLAPNGALVSAFNAQLTTGIASAIVDALLLQTDGKLVVGGLFSAIGGEARDNIARLSTTQVAAQSLDMTGTTVTLRRTGSAPEFAQPPQLALSTDGSTFTALGPMHYASGMWTYSGLPLQLAQGQNFFLRARGVTQSGLYGSSSAPIDSVRQFYFQLVDAIFANGFQ